jgi:hypothetical protein
MTQEFTTCTSQELLSDVLSMMQARGLIHVLLIRDKLIWFSSPAVNDAAQANLKADLFCMLVTPQDRAREEVGTSSSRANLADLSNATRHSAWV